MRVYVDINIVPVHCNGDIIRRKKCTKNISMKIIIIQKLRDMLVENLYDSVFLINFNRNL